MALPHLNLPSIPSPASCCCCRCQHFRILRGNAPPTHSLLVGFARRPVISSPAGLGGFLSGSLSRGLRKRAVTVSPWILNAATPTRVLDNATAPATATVEINVTCYQLLGLRNQAEKDEVVKSVIQLKSAEVEDGYTMDAIMSRKDLLMDVRDKVLFEPEYAGNVRDKIPPKSSLYIPWAWLPGALSLLQEVGEEKLVLDIGRKAIQKPDAKPYIHDILLSMALAECAIAKINFENNKVSFGFEALARAQCLLRSKISLGKMALLAQIEESLEELAPACTLEILSMPRSPENAERRRGAIAALRELLRQGLDAEMSCRVQDWPCFLIQAFNRLMATEIVDLLPWDDLALTRRNKKSLESHTQRAVIDFDCFYVALIAHIALGFSFKQTKLINRAKDICGTLIASEGIDLKLEEAFCLFLLGEGNEAQVIDKLQQLELNVNPAPRILISGKEKNVATSVKSPVETWLKDSVLAAFSDTRDCSPSLVGFFSGERRTEGEKSKLPSLSTKRGTGQRPFSDFSSERMNHGGESLSFKTSSQHLGSAVKQLTLVDLQPSLMSDKSDDQASEDPPPVQLKRNLDMRDNGNWESWPSYGNVVGKIIFVVVLGCITFITSKLSYRSLRSPTFAVNKHIADTASHSDISDFSHDSIGGGGIGDRMKKLSATVKTKFYTLPRHSTSQNSGVTTGRKSSTRAVSRKQMPVDEAEALVRQWQTVKAEALGPEHQIQSLSELLAESMLDQWQELADAAHSKSCYWRFLLLDLSILKADVVSDGFGMETAEIEALLEEAAELVDESQQKKNPNYHSKYKIRYALKRQDDGSWRFCKCEIQSPS
ncbi:unnamed protein product [Linum tenue]|uniref:ARC6 IMS domain-containing protein n=1 Tax=Linum tenue TaxID=586396 RepID=A0AAV0IV79_9ROSI|nr:unnamed protein product [Linum tenue]